MMPIGPSMAIWPHRRQGPRRTVRRRAATIIAEERSLRERRCAHELTQKNMAEALGVGQDSVSRGDVEAMGGKLSRVAVPTCPGT
jgi:hypothetical protein